jgi:glycosyltransferase involved in cell wall biosynthesis
MKIVFVHEVSWYNKVVYEMHDFPELLSLRGHEVRFLDFDEGRPHAKWRSLVRTESRAHTGSAVQVTTGPRILPGIAGRLLATILQPIMFLRLVNEAKPDVVVTYSIPTSGWQITALCNQLGIPIVARVIDVSHVLRKTFFERLVKRAEAFVYRNADHVSTHNSALLQYCRELGAKELKSSVICPGVDLVRFSSGRPNAILQGQLGLDAEDKVVLFMGTLFRFSGLFELLTELIPALKSDTKLKFLILGDGEDFCRLQSLVQDSKTEQQVLFAGRIDYVNLPEFLRLGCVAVLPFKQELVTHAALPAKVLQYLACGLPTVSIELKGLQSIVGPDDGVAFVPSIERMSSEIVSLLSDSQRMSLLSERARGFVQANCDWSTQIHRFEQVLESVQCKDGQQGMTTI